MGLLIFQDIFSAKLRTLTLTKESNPEIDGVAREGLLNTILPKSETNDNVFCDPSVMCIEKESGRGEGRDRETCLENYEELGRTLLRICENIHKKV